MKELTLINVPLGASGHISRCLSPARADVYRLLEMGLCKGTQFTIMRKASLMGVIELAIGDSRLCIADDIASQFMAILPISRSHES
jgi:Fe2+ transport system protein FeoA